MIIIRMATENDLQSMLDIYNEIIMNNTAIFQYDMHTLQQRKEWFAQKKKKIILYLSPSKIIRL
jgi:phosphinothricin acetyltransferase